MTDEEKACYKAETKALQLTDHITSGKPDVYYVYDAYSGYGAFDSYESALDKFNSLKTPGYCYIHLATRIGTGVEVLSKVNS